MEQVQNYNDWVLVEKKQREYNYKFKILLIAATENTGKTSIVRRYVNGIFEPNAPKSVGSTYSTKICALSEQIIKLKIWCLSSKESSKLNKRIYYGDVNGVLLLFDLHKPWEDSETNLLHNLAEFLAHTTISKSSSIPIILVGTKCDKRIASNFDSARNFANKHRMLYVETSAKRNSGIERVMSLLTKMMISELTVPEFSEISDPEKPKFTLKLVVIGEKNAGKTNLIARFVENRFDQFSDRSIFFKQIDVRKNRIKLQIWDFGESSYNVGESWALFRSVDGVIFVIDLQQSHTEDDVHDLLNRFKTNCQLPNPDTVPKILIGAKCENISLQKVKQSWIQNFASQNNLAYISTSAKDNIYVTEAFEMIIRTIYNQKMKRCIIS